MRIEYGLSTTSLASLLDSSALNAHKQAALDEANTQATQTKQTAKSAKSTHKSPKTLESATESMPKPSGARETFGLEILEKMSDKEYEIFLRASEGLSEVEKMAAAQALYIFTESYASSPSTGESKIESSAQSSLPNALDSSTGESKLESKNPSTAAAKPLESNPAQISAQAPISAVSTALDMTSQATQPPQDQYKPPSHPATPRTPKNPYFSARESFITRYVALYHGAQEMDILG